MRFAAAVGGAGDGGPVAALARPPRLLRGGAARARPGRGRRRVVLWAGRARPRPGRADPRVLRADRGSLLAAGARARGDGLSLHRLSVRGAPTPAGRHGGGRDVGGAGRLPGHLVRGAALPLRQGSRPGRSVARSPGPWVGRPGGAPNRPLGAGGPRRPRRGVALLRDVVCPPQLTSTTLPARSSSDVKRG